ncbi:MAG: ribonuclease HII [Candidatus Promineifilaceae bacterium]
MPDLTFETAVYQPPTICHIAGLDEAGRGALAGPVVAAAVILPLDSPSLAAQLTGVNDSKQLTAAKRETLYTVVMETAVAWSIGQVSAAVIDEIGIIPATRQAMRAALSQLTVAADYLLIDGRIRLANLPTPQQSIIRGDGKSLSIAAASILAKVTRDRYMVAQDSHFPSYGFAQHKGYGTAVHLQALAKHGPSPLHRQSFSPLRQTLL